MMAKNAALYIRIDDDAKERITEAARREGKSMTTFILEAAEKEARRVQSRKPSAHGVHTGVPGFFRACCREASRGGDFGYDHPGYHLAMHLNDQMPYDVEEDEWTEELATMTDLLTEDDIEGVWDWFRRRFPRAIKLVPARRREQFVRGVQRAHEDGRIEL